MAPYFVRQIVSFYALFPALSLHKFLIYYCVECSPLFLPPLSILFRRFRSIASTILFFIFPHSPGFHFSCDDLSSYDPLSLSLSISSAPLFPRRRIFCQPSLVFAALQRASDLTLSSYVSSILYPWHLSPHRPRVVLTVRRTLESHKALRRIFHCRHLPPVAMKGGIRHDGRSGRRKMGRSRLNEVGRNFLGLLSNALMQRDDWEKERRLQSDW